VTTHEIGAMVFAHPASRTKNLFIVCDRRKSWKDFHEIGREIRAEAKDISVHIVPGGFDSAAIPPQVWAHPALTVSFVRDGFVPKRGKCFFSRAISKTEQYRRFLAAGLPSPRTAVFRFGTVYDPAEWGEFVVLKPADLGQTSDKDNVRLLRTGHLNGLDTAGFSGLGFAPATTLLIQTFIDTGPHPQHYRVLTLFGEPLYAQHKSMHRKRVDLTAPDDDIAQAVVADGVGQSTRSFGDYPDVLAFARKVAEVFAEVPLLGMDVMKAAASGELSVLEVNAGGNTWHFSSPASAYWRQAHPEYLKAMKEQFGAFKAAARALIRQTRNHAC